MKLQIKKSRLWVPAAGIVLALGFMNNCIVLPFLDGGDVVPWDNLVFTLAILLGLGGARDIALRKFRYLGKVLEESKLSQSKGFWTNKIWIPAIGWVIVGGLAINCCIHPFINVGEVDWAGLLSALSILLTVSGVREYGIYAEDRKILNNEESDNLTRREISD